MNALYGFFVRRPLLVNLCMVGFVAGALLSLKSMTYQMFPTFDLGIATVTAHWPGSGPEDMELSVTAPLEEEILKVDGLDRVLSNSMEGLSIITIRLDPDARDPGKILADIQRAVDRASAKLPEDLPGKPLLEEMSSSRMPIMEIHVSGPVPEETRRLVARRLSDGLRGVDGVAGTERVGYRKREVRILLDPAKVQRLGISWGEIAGAIAGRNIRHAGGSVETGGEAKKVLTSGRFRSPKEVAEVIIRSKSPGNHVRIGDVAEVALDYEDWTVQSQIDGVPSIALSVLKKERASAPATARAVRRYLETARIAVPAGVRLTIVNDVSRFTLDMLRILVGNALVGLGLVMVFLPVFFGLRLAIWVAAGLPVALCIALTVTPLLGLGLDSVTIGSLIMVLGMLVDDAIVTAESIFRYREMGMHAQEASIRGTRAVAAPVIAATMTTLLAFLPLAFIGGYEGKFFWMGPVMVALALGGSLLECQLMLPSHLAHGKGGQPPQRRWFDRVPRAYSRIIRLLIRRRYPTITGFIAATLAVFLIGATTIRFNLYPEPDESPFFIKVELPEGATFRQTGEKVRELEAIVREVIPPGEILHITAVIGHHDTDFYGAREGGSPAWALIKVHMPPQGGRRMKVGEAIEALRGRIKGLGGYRSIMFRPFEDAPVMGRPVELEVMGNDARRNRVASLLAERLKGFEGVTDVWTSRRNGRKIVRVAPDYAALAARGLSAADVAEAVRIALDGAVIAELQTVDERIAYRLQFRPEDQRGVQTLRDLILINKRGLPVPLRSVADLETVRGEANIKHLWGQRTTTVFAEIDRGRVSTAEINSRIERFVDRNGLLKRYPGIHLHFGGELEQQREAEGNVNTAFAVCLLGIFFVLVLLFNSLTQPFLVMAVIPFGFTGVVLAYCLQGIEFTMMAVFGILGLAGVLVNDSLVMIHGLNQRLQQASEGAQLADVAIADTAATRVRPILVTSLTTVVGLLPSAYGWMGSHRLMTTVAMTLCWGVAFGTFATLLVLPCLYAVERDLRGWIARLRQKPGRGK